MELTITGKNMNVSERTQTMVRNKLNKLERHLTGTTQAHAELKNEKTKSASQRHIVQVTLVNNGTTIRAQERAADLKDAVDAVVDKLDKQIRRHKDKQLRRRRHAPDTATILEAVSDNDHEPDSQIVRTKRFRVTAMDADEAVEQMELLGHSFYMFLNGGSGDINVVYKRDDGAYGVLEPELA